MDEQADQEKKGGIKLRISLFFESLKKIPLHIYIWVVALIALSLVVLAFFFPSIIPSFFKNLIETPPPSKEQKENVAEPFKPSPIPLAPGRQVYSISGGKTGAPRMTQATIDPLDVEEGQLQTFEVKAFDEESEITKITATVVTDNSQETYSLKLSDGTAQEGTWNGSWRIADTFLYNYQLVLTVTNQNGNESTVTMTFR